MNTPPSYQVNLEVFQGPLDLLLFLIRKKKIEIQDIPIAIITKEYLEYLEKKEQISLEHEAEFLLMAALLIHIKSQMLLPREAALEQEKDPRRNLVARLLDYQNIKAACSLMRKKENKQLQKWQRTFLPPLTSLEELEFIEVTLFDLAEVFFTLMKRREQESIKIIKGKTYSLQEKTQEILDFLYQNDYLDFITYFNQQKSLDEALLSFFCLLDLVKSKTIMVVQDILFGSIKVWLRKESSP
jgi:segregation and condensation protein A